MHNGQTRITIEKELWQEWNETSHKCILLHLVFYSKIYKYVEV